MAPLVAFITAVATNFVLAVASVFYAAGFSTAAALAAGRLLLQIGASLIINALFAPKRASVSQRQAQTLEVTLGEHPREALLGRTATGGSLLNVWNDGAENEFETVVISLADHPIDAIESFYVNDKEYTLSTQGDQGHADFQDGGSRLSIQWALGNPDQTTVSLITTQGVAAGQWTSDEAANGFKGFAYVVARYKISEKVWKSGRPRFIWKVRGLKAYDPRKDSTVPGGAGAHRWGQPSTYEWTENARVLHYNYVRGIHAYPTSTAPGQLVVGPGKSAEEAPPELVIADANLCDEPVPLKAGGTEPRYRVSAVIRADSPWIDEEENFAAAMGGQLVERGGTIGVDPGVWKTVSAEFTDDDLLSGQELQYQAYRSRHELANTVVTRYVEPAQLWQPATAPLRRDLADVAADGEAREQPLELAFVAWQTQAQRCGEIVRRKARLQKSAIVTLGPRFMLLEDGDWVVWRSQRRFEGQPRLFEVFGVAHDAEGRVTLILKEIDSLVFAWDAAVDQLDPAPPTYTPPTLPGVTRGQVAETNPTSAGLFNRWPHFEQWWDGSLPAGFSNVGSLTVTKNTSSHIFGAWVLDTDAPGSGNEWLAATGAPNVQHVVPPDLTYVVIEWDVTLVSGNFQRAGVLWRTVHQSAGDLYDWRVSLFDEHPSPSTGVRYRGSKVIARAVGSGSPTGAPTAGEMYVMSNWGVLSGGANSAKRIRWNRVAVRPATVQEIAAHLALTSIGAFRARNVNGGASGTFSTAPLTGVSSTEIFVAAATWTGAGGETVSIPSGTIGSLANSTKYWVFRDTVAGSFVATSSFATATSHFSDVTGRYLALGNATTDPGGGVGGGGAAGGGGQNPN